MDNAQLANRVLDSLKGASMIDSILALKTVTASILSQLPSGGAEIFARQLQEQIELIRSRDIIAIAAKSVK